MSVWRVGSQIAPTYKEACYTAPWSTETLYCDIQSVYIQLGPFVVHQVASSTAFKWEKETTCI